MIRPRWWYADSSALVKLVVEEDWSDDLRNAVASVERLVVCALAVTEVHRALSCAALPDWQTRAASALSRCTIMRLDRPLLEAASRLEPTTVRSLDAIHLAAADRLRRRLDAVVTYDVRMGEAAQLNGWTVLDPGRDRFN